MMAEARCPYCGASEDANGPRLTFECGTGGSCEGSVIRAAPCYCREINGLKAENELLKECVDEQRRMIQEIGRSMRDSRFSEYCVEHMNSENERRQLIDDLTAASAKIAELEAIRERVEMCKAYTEKLQTDWRSNRQLAKVGKVIDAILDWKGAE